MTDRELLEMAAKAAGIELDFTIRGDFPPYFVNERGGHSSWNPLTDDGDALRLAIDLELNVFHTSGRAYAMPSDYESDNEQTVSYSDSGGKYAATRRAIVRAAAEIGRSMP